MIVGGYVLHLYCDSGVKHEWSNMAPGDPMRQDYPMQFTGRNQQECERQARRVGWVLRQDGTALCPECRATTRRLTTATDPPTTKDLS